MKFLIAIMALLIMAGGATAQPASSYQPNGDTYYSPSSSMKRESARIKAYLNKNGYPVPPLEVVTFDSSGGVLGYTGCKDYGKIFIAKYMDDPAYIRTLIYPVALAHEQLHNISVVGWTCEHGLTQMQRDFEEGLVQQIAIDTMKAYLYKTYKVRGHLSDTEREIYFEQRLCVLKLSELATHTASNSYPSRVWRRTLLNTPIDRRDAILSPLLALPFGRAACTIS